MSTVCRRSASVLLGAAFVAAVLGASQAGAGDPTPTTSVNGRIAFVSSWAENLAAEVYRVDVATGRRTNLSRDPSIDDEGVVSPDGKTILFRTSRDNFASIWAMDADGTDQRSLAAGASPVWSPDGTRIAFERGGDVMTMAADGTGLRRLGHGRSQRWSPGGRLLAWIDDGTLTVGAPDGSGARRLGSTAAATLYSFPAWARDGTRIAFAAEEVLPSGRVSRRVITVSVADGDVRTVATVRPSESPSEIRPTWSPDGAWIAYVDGRQILGVRVADQAVAALTRPPGERADTLPAWSPDGRSLAFARSGRGGTQLFVVSALGGVPRQITHDDARSSFLPQDLIAWTPDGRSLVYSSQVVDNDSDIYTVNPDGSGRRRLTTNDVVDRDPSFSPDGRWIAFVRELRVAGNTELFLMRADGSEVRRLTRWAGEDHTPTWSPDGSQIAFVRRTAGKDAELSLYTIRPDGTHLTRLRTPDDFYDSPSWSPDGRAIAVTVGAGVDMGGAVIVVRADGRGPHTLVDPGEDVDWYPEWSPDGRVVTFARQTACDYCDEVSDLSIVRRDGTGERRLVEDARDAAWSPDGHHLVVLGDDLRIVSSSGLFDRQLTATRAAGAPGLSWQPVCTLRGGSHGDRLRAGEGRQRVCGLGGDDRLRGGPGRDHLFGEGGDDRIDARRGGFDVVGCGPGTDRVVADRRDLVGVDCEHVTRR